VVLAKAVLAVERIIEDDNLRGLVGIVFELGKKKCERQSAAVAGAESVSERRFVEWRLVVA
jgi:hypothetical protein